MVSAVHAALTLGRWDLGAAALATWARHGVVYLAYVVDGGVKRHGVDRGITLGDAENGRLSIFSSIYRCACRRTKKRGLGRTEHAVTCGVPHQNIPRGRVLCFFEAGVEESEQNKLRADQVVRPNAVPRQGVSCGDFWSFSGRSVSKRV